MHCLPKSLCCRENRALRHRCCEDMINGSDEVNPLKEILPLLKYEGSSRKRINARVSYYLTNQVVGGVTPGTFKTAPVEVTPPPQQQQQSYAAAATSFVAPASVIQCVGGQQTSVIQSSYATTTAENREASSAFELLQSGTGRQSSYHNLRQLMRNYNCYR